MCNVPREGIDFLPIRYLYIQFSGNGFLRGGLLKDFANQYIVELFGPNGWYLLTLTAL